MSYADPDVYTLTIPEERVSDVRQFDNGNLRIEFTPEQAEEFKQFVEEEL